MNNDELNEKLKQITIEDYIWIIYLGIIFLSWYGNSYERKYYINNDINSKTKYKNITILIFSILIIVYLYFFKNSVNDLKNMPYKVWRDIIYTMYWNKWKADTIEDQHVANMVVDWVWHSGAGTIKKVQAILGTTQDGIVGNKTITALNSANDMLTKVYNARKAYFESIVKRNPSQKKWLNGWMNRINYIYKLS